MHFLSLFVLLFSCRFKINWQKTMCTACSYCITMRSWNTETGTLCCQSCHYVAALILIFRNVVFAWINTALWECKKMQRKPLYFDEVTGTINLLQLLLTFLLNSTDSLLNIEILFFCKFSLQVLWKLLFPCTYSRLYYVTPKSKMP